MQALIGTCVFLGLLATQLCSSHAASYHWDYIIVGAGPSGLQLGYFMQRAQRDYVILERSNVSGNFFTTYPRHDTLISINKRHTGKTNKEFNFRHDWNSLISDDESLLMKHYSKEFFPHRTTLLRYLDDYQKKFNINVWHNREVSDVQRVVNESAGGHSYTMKDQNGNFFSCKTLILATGVWKSHQPQFEGSEYVEGYEDISLNPDDYEGKSVLILGRGNAAFEVADGIFGATNLVHMIGRSRVRLSWATHYVGDLRAVNNNLLDNYQLKSLDGVLEAPVNEMKLVKRNGRFYLDIGQDEDSMEATVFDNFAMREPYDKVIRCLGFEFDFSIFSKDSDISKGRGRKKKYPLIMHNYESIDFPGLFIAGTASHSLDHRKSAGGFIHGFRYTARALHRILEWRNHESQWPSTTVLKQDLLAYILKRVNEASGTYQMFSVLGDVFVFRNNGESYRHYEEFPVQLLPQFTNITGVEAERVLVVVMEYGANFSGPGQDIFRLDRATGEPSEAHRSNFLHPVLYYYKKLPTEEDMQKRTKYQLLPRPDRMHHIVEDFLTSWDGPVSHILPLRRFLETINEDDMRNFFAEECFHLALTHETVPFMCQNAYMDGSGLLGTQELKAQPALSGLLVG